VNAFDFLTGGSNDLGLEHLVRLKPNLPIRDIEVLMDSFDQNTDGIIELDEFVSGLCLMCMGTPKEKISLIFYLYGADSNKMLSRSDLLAMLVQLNNRIHALGIQQR
jgi:Ca2+-binding EF-hand superfamily protein